MYTLVHCAVVEMVLLCICQLNLYPGRDRSAMSNVEWFSGTERNIPPELGLASVAIGLLGPPA